MIHKSAKTVLISKTNNQPAELS